MTRYPPRGSPPEGYRPASGYRYQQSQYGNTPPAGNSGGYLPENSGYPPYNHQPNAQPQYNPSYQPYQQYPQASPSGSYPPPNMQQPHGGYPPPAGPPGYQTNSNVPSFPPRMDQQGAPAAGPYHTPPPPNADEDDRGIMGALAGGAAGAYGGHKMGHGLLGALGGAFAGHKLEDVYKDHREEKKKKKKHSRRGSSGSSCSGSSSSSDCEDDKPARHDAPVVAGNFHASSRNVHLENGAVLVAECGDGNGHHPWSRIDLNDCITNNFGRLEWRRGGNFGASAHDIRLEEGGSILEAELGDGRGGRVRDRIYLNERISNEHGRLVML